MFVECHPELTRAYKKSILNCPRCFVARLYTSLEQANTCLKPIGSLICSLMVLKNYLHPH